MIKTEYENIKELTDFEEGLRFAIHRLLELKMLQFEYLKNPYYTLSELKDSNLQDITNEEVDSINSTVNSLIQNLLDLEQSQINTKLYYQKELSSFE